MNERATIERFPRLRDRVIFVGNPEDIVPDTFGSNLPAIRAWTELHYDFAGHITGFDPAASACNHQHYPYGFLPE